MEEQIEYEGKLYYKRNGKWYDKQYNCEATINTQNKLNSIYDNQIDYDKMSYSDIVKIADGYKESESFIRAIKSYEKAIEKTNDINEIKYILPRITSCYRKNNQPDSAVELYTKICKEYGYDILNDALLTSIAAAYIDLEQYENAKKYADKAYAMSNGNCSDELKSVYSRLRKYI